MKQIFLFLSITVFFIACSKKKSKEVSLSGIDAAITIERLEKKLTSFATEPDVEAFISQYPLFSKEFLGADQFPELSFLTSNMLRMAQDPYIDTLNRDALNVFPSLSQLESQLSNAYKHLKYYYPSQKIPKAYSCVSGFGTDLLVNDEIIVLGLDFFTAGKSQFIPRDIPGYILKYYSEDYIPTKAMALVSQKYNRYDMLDKTLLSQMIYYGKSYYFIEHMLPSLADSMIVEYSSKEIEDLKFMAPKVWAHFVEKKLFFETSRDAVRRYIEDRPHTIEVADKCPGRIGRWLGWQIVRSYMDRNPDVSLQQLMEDKDASRLFNKAKYKP